MILYSILPILSLLAQGLPQSAAPSEPPVEFDVASVKLSAPPNITPASAGAEIRVGTRVYGNRVEYSSMNLRQLIAEAYGVRGFQIKAPEGGFPRDRFDIVAKMPTALTRPRAALALRTLLAQRFGLQIRRETETLPVWALVVAKDGPKFQQSQPDNAPGQASAPAKAPAQVNKNGDPVIVGIQDRATIRMTLDSRTSTIHYKTERLTMPLLAQSLDSTTLTANRQIIDRTGLQGEYDLNFDLPMASGSGADTPASPGDDASAPGSGATLRSIRNLGLDLVKQTAEVEILVVERVAKAPTQN